jgi:hypothetical protein
MWAAGPLGHGNAKRQVLSLVLPCVFRFLKRIAANFCWVLRLTHIVSDLLAA